jgi:hypothetical protein
MIAPMLFALGFPAAPPSWVRGRSGTVNVQRSGSPTLARRLSPTAALSADTLAQAGVPASGAITMEARQLQGAEAIDVSGTAPAGAPVTITLLAVISTELPTIVVSRHDAVTDVSGRFEATIPVASAFERGTILRVVATSAPGVASASAELVEEAPNAGITVPLEQFPY